MIVGVVGDLHAPFTHPMYLPFVQDTFAEWQVNRVHFVGDIVDLHALSFWEHDPNGHSASDESALAGLIVDQWYNVFPAATVNIGNHDERHYRAARKAGIPDRFLRTYRDIWKTPRWKWDFEHWIDEVLFTHGTGSSGKDAAVNLAIQKRSSLVMGHIHTWGSVKWHSNSRSTIFGMNAGCGIDCPAYAFAYGRDFPIRPVLGCGIVEHGEQAFFVKMPCSPGEKYHRSRAPRRRRAA